jgi:hypothetical protein
MANAPLSHTAGGKHGARSNGGCDMFAWRCLLRRIIRVAGQRRRRLAARDKRRNNGNATSSAA